MHYIKRIYVVADYIIRRKKRRVYKLLNYTMLLLFLKSADARLSV